ncbi:MAG: 1-deoxy-D-xylulose-5-phosphate reductoisomerase [Bacteroidetes bacterium]|nr:1-deoxy-D-xylulose-5-phosphate reductoisomerase [Bacteroidota bacterium]
MNRSKKILAVFGSTGSIGRNTLEVARRHPDHFSVRYLTGNSNAELLIEQIRAVRPAAVAVSDPVARNTVRDAVGDLTTVLNGANALDEIAGRDDYDTMVSGLVGFAGLLPTTTAIRAGKSIALANKETLVVAGEIITALAREHNVRILPIDSEHSAIQQCILGEHDADISRIILTASGGPFRGYTAEQLRGVTPAQALKHPNWSMGNKITIDSATMMNKGLEVIEAHWLFGVDPDAIDVVVHPQSIIHSMVEFSDGSVKAQLGIPDMKIPIHYALTWPDRIASDYERMDIARIGTLTFEQPDPETFPCLRLAYDVLRTGGSAAASLNAANEIAVDAFLHGLLPFPGIAEIIEECINQLPQHRLSSIDDVLDADRDARNWTKNRIAKTASQ